MWVFDWESSDGEDLENGRMDFLWDKLNLSRWGGRGVLDNTFM